MINLYICLGVFTFLLWFNYIGAKGRIEGKNQLNNKAEDLGYVSEKDFESLLEGTHKRRAFIQAVIGSTVWTTLLYVLLYFIN